MGTNFYLYGHREDHDNSPDVHIGKRSAAGAYCWDCCRTLCEDGEGAIHSGRSGWRTTCPECGQACQEEAMSTSSAGRELGFNKSVPAIKTGVSSCASFSWAMPIHRFMHYASVKEGPVAEDEYGEVYTLQQFLAVLSECPIVLTDRIGTRFS